MKRSVAFDFSEWLVLWVVPMIEVKSKSCAAVASRSAVVESLLRLASNRGDKKGINRPLVIRKKG